jgi:hypothetical protein
MGSGLVAFNPACALMASVCPCGLQSAQGPLPGFSNWFQIERPLLDEIGEAQICHSCVTATDTGELFAQLNEKS